MSEDLFGWVPPEDRDAATQEQFEAVASALPEFVVAGKNIAGSGAGKTVLLHKYLEQLHGSYPCIRQQIGDCVSFGYAKAIEILMAVEILVKGEPEEWPGALVATEWIYGTSRVLVGKGRLGNGDGSLGAWASQAIRDHGTLLRKAYSSVDLSSYSGQRAKSWGYRGLPAEELEPTADQHPVKETAMVTSYEQARDAIANGYPVPVCSQQGFSRKRDSEGFAKPEGRWAHCMAFVDVDDAYRRPGLLLDNCSWGPTWVTGPKRHDQPDGTVWVDADVCDRMLKQRDSYALSSFKGYPARQLDYDFIRR